MNNYGFPIVKKGYSPEEVDNYIEELNSRISYLQDQNTKLTAKISEAQEMIDKYSETEMNLRHSIADSKRAAAEMLSDARDRSAALLDASRNESCKIIDELDRQIEERYKTIENIKANVISFRNRLFDLYSTHIEDIEAFSNIAEGFVYDPDFTQLSMAIDAFEESGEPETPETPEFPEMPEESFFAEADKLEPEEFTISEEAQLALEAEAVLAEEVPTAEFEVEEFGKDEAGKEVLDGTEMDDMFMLEEDGIVFPEIKEDEMFIVEEDNTADLEVLDGLPEIEEDDDMFATEEEASAQNMGDIFGSFIDEDDDMFKETTKEDEEYFKFLNDFINED